MARFTFAEDANPLWGRRAMKAGPDGIDLLLKARPSEVLKANDSRREIVHVITSRIVDRDGDVVEPKGLRLEHYRLNPVVLLGHWGDMAIGRNVGIDLGDQEAVATTQFAGLEQANDEAEAAYRMYRDGFMKAWSIGFQPVTWSEDKALPDQSGWWFQSAELYEYSGVVVPSNPLAVTRMVKAYGLPQGASEKDLLDAVRKDRKPFFDVGAALAKQEPMPDVPETEKTTPAKAADILPEPIVKQGLESIGPSLQESLGHLKLAIGAMAEAQAEARAQGDEELAGSMAECLDSLLACVDMVGTMLAEPEAPAEPPIESPMYTEDSVRAAVGAAFKGLGL